MQAYSTPITPPPTTIRVFGTWGMLKDDSHAARGGSHPHWAGAVTNRAAGYRHGEPGTSVVTIARRSPLTNYRKEIVFADLASFRVQRSSPSTADSGYTFRMVVVLRDGQILRSPRPIPPGIGPRPTMWSAYALSPVRRMTS